ncbi:hypothetical protein ES703_63458 [subsurface metagenome]
MPPRRTNKSTSAPTTSLTHADTRKNIPTEELSDFVADDEATPLTLLYPRHAGHCPGGDIVLYLPLAIGRCEMRGSRWPWEGRS